MKLGDKLYYRALIGTMLIFIFILFSSFLLTNKLFSFLWFIGAFNIAILFSIMLYINWSFIEFNELMNKGEKKENE